MRPALQQMMVRHARTQLRQRQQRVLDFWISAACQSNAASVSLAPDLLFVPLVESHACNQATSGSPSAGPKQLHIDAPAEGHVHQLSTHDVPNSRQPWPRRLPHRHLLPFHVPSCSLANEPSLIASQRRHFCAGPEANPAPATYNVTVITGDVRGAGSPAPAVIQLVGSEGVSDPVTIANDPDSPGFSRGERTEVMVEVSHDLGELLRVVVKQAEQADSEIGVGWFLDSVQVTSPGGQCRTFPCSNWLGRSDADGHYIGDRERNLIPPHADVEHVTEYLAEPLQVASAAVVVPHPHKVTPKTKAVLHQDFGYGGEDAYYSSWGPRNGMLGLGVSDGVYMWRSQGIDAGVFSRSLMLSAKNAIQYGQTDVLNVMMDAASTVEENGIQGSATCCLVVVDTLQGRLNSANLGDSGYVILSCAPPAFLKVPVCTYISQLNAAGSLRPFCLSDCQTAIAPCA